MRTTEGLARVDAIYRRLDDDFIDPLEFRPDSLLGVPGLIRAYRAGTVALANAVGTGVADDKAVYSFVPEMIRYYLGEEPLLDNVPTYLLRDPDQLEYVLDRLDSWSSSRPASRAARACSSARGDRRGDRPPARSWSLAAPGPLDRPGAGQPLHHPDRRRRRRDSSPRHVDLRPFAVYGSELRIIPGGLTRVALTEGSMIVNSSRGGGSKDTWVLERGRPRGHTGARPTRTPELPEMPAIPHSTWTGQEQQQQQQRAQPDRGDR